MVFARLANGDAEPIRVIAGQATLLSRTSHYISVDSVHDEVVATNPFAEAILFFRGGAGGDEAPVRIIQGPKTLLMHTGVDNVTVDPINHEIFTANQHTGAVLVFDRRASGDVAPKRILRGPKTRLNGPKRVIVDPLNNLLFVAQRTDPKGLLIFNRTDSGDVPPKAIISGPKTGLKGGVKRFALDPERKRIFALGAQGVAVWNYSDNGDVPPYALLRKTEATKLEQPGGIALNPEAKEIILDAGGNPASIVVYHLPELF